MSWDIEVHEKVYQRLANEFSFVFCVESMRWAQNCFLHRLCKRGWSSPETVRKAIRELQQQGVVEKTRRGYFVTSDKAAVITFRQQYLASVEKEYHTQKRK